MLFFFTHLYPHRICVRSISCWCCDWLCGAFVWSELRLFYPLWWRRDRVTCCQWWKNLPLLLEKIHKILVTLFLLIFTSIKFSNFCDFKKFTKFNTFFGNKTIRILKMFWVRVFFELCSLTEHLKLCFEHWTVWYT